MKDGRNAGEEKNNELVNKEEQSDRNVVNIHSSVIERQLKMYE